MINFGYNCLPDQKEQKQLSEQQNSEKYFSFSLPKLSPSDFILLFISFILFCISGMPLPLVSTAATILAAPLYAVFSHKTGNVFRLSAPISAFIITFIGNIIVFKNFAGALGVLLSAGMAFAIFISVCKKAECSKTSAVIGCTIVFILYIAVSFLVLWAQGVISLKIISEFMNEYYELLRETIIQDQKMNSGPFDTKISESDLNILIEYIFFNLKTLIPSITIIICLISSYISASLLNPFAKLFNDSKMLEGKKYEITLSYASVIVYFIASLFMLFAGNSAAAYGFRNIAYIIAPGLMLCGIKQIGEVLAKRGFSKFAICIAKICSVFIAFLFLNIGVTVLILLGMFYTTNTSRTGGSSGKNI